MINYQEEWILGVLLKFKGSVALKALSFAIPATALTIALQALDTWDESFREDNGLMSLSGSTIWSAAMAALVFLVGFRTNRSISRFWEGTGLLHQMRGEWFDTVSNCVTFSIIAAKNEEKKKAVTEFRHTLVRLMSLCHGNALEEISNDQFLLDTIDVFGLNDDTLMHLKNCYNVYGFNKVEVCLHLIQSLITWNFQQGILDVPPPILSRVYQTISRGFVHLLNTKKITDTKFPFPYAQLIAFLLSMNTLLTPVLLSSAVTNRYLAPIFTFVPVFSLSAINYISIELDNPFGRDPNDLPLEHFQREMNCCLMMLLHPDSDLIAHVKSEPDCIMDFEELYKLWKDGKSARASQIPTTTVDETKQKNLRRFNTEKFEQMQMKDTASDFSVAAVAGAGLY
mmetsp:Transcript_82161/g.232908  ORF Transcript_82161/g.232908 Transcript_82161/m.232908 type:complete len:397 (-) Transcript_82161:128-1318(-)